MLKVLHILTRLIRGGADEAVLLSVAGLQARNFDVTLLVGGDSDQAYVTEAAQNMTICTEPALRRDVHPLCDLTALYRLVRRIKRGRYAIVHTHTAKAGFLGRLAAKMAGVPIIIHTLHGLTFHPFRPPIAQALYIFFEKMAAGVTDRFIAVGEDLRRQYVQKGIGRPAQYTMIRTGMDIDRFLQAGHLSVEVLRQKREEFGLTPADVVIGLAARLEPGKGQQYLFQAASQLVARFPHVKLLLVGDGPDRARLVNLVNALQLERHVIFAGFRRDIAEVIAIFDLAVCTSLWEGLPRVLVQYAAAGKPIVAFAIPGVVELVKNGVNGLTVPLKDVAGLAARLLFLLEHPADARNMGRAGRQGIDAGWRVETMLTRLIEEYHALLGAGSWGGRELGR